jgi:predicted Zn finger-like uncharacterized protein
MIRFSCPKCQAVIKVDDHRAGEKVYCPTCSQKLLIPTPPPPPVPNPTVLGQLEPTAGQTVIAEVLPAAPDPFDFDAPPPPPPPVPYPIGAPGYAVHPYERRRRHRDSTNGMLALVFGILGLVSFPLLGIAAIILGRQALRENPDDGMAKAGLILGWIDVGFTILFCLGFALYFLFFVLLFTAAASSTRPPVQMLFGG